MNKLNIENFEKFPITRETMSFIQDMIYMSARVAALGGTANYILSGCVENGNSVSAGYVVIDGEILPFEVGTKVATVTIVENKASVVANGNTYADMRIARSVRFATGTGVGYYNWADFKRIETLIELAETRVKKSYVDEEIAALASKYVPTGAIIMWSGAIVDIPTGWALCDGQLVGGKRLPDLRGRFVVGYNSYGADYSTIGAMGGVEKHKLSESEMPSHKHSVNDYYYIESAGKAAKPISGTERLDQGYTGSNSTDTDNNTLLYKTHDTAAAGQSTPHENRPPYFVLAFIIKL